MKKWLAFICLVTILSSCKQRQDDYFEGIVESNISVETFYKEYLDGFSKAFGKRSITYLNKRGDVCREMFDESDALFTKEIIRMDSLKMYSFKIGSDTMFVMDISEHGNSRLVSLEKTAPKEILGKQTIGIKASYKIALEDSNDSMLQSTAYYNCPDYKLNPSSFSTIKRDYYDSLMKGAPFLTLRYEQNYGDYAKMYATATKIERKAVPDSIFNVPQNKIRIAKQL